VIEGDGILARADETLVDHVEHLEERHVLAGVAGVGLELARRRRVLLPPDVQGDAHYL
jgi:hypothetical protein